MSAFDGNAFNTSGFYAGVPALVSRRAIILVGGKRYELPIGQEGTGKKPLVWDGTRIKERATTEGTPLIIVAGQLRLLNAATESLVL